jgi:hypothetical protein
MALQDVRAAAFEEEDPDLGELTTDECAAIRAAAAAEGYSETFADLLCRFAELIGVEQVLLELKQLKDQLKDETPS